MATILLPRLYKRTKTGATQIYTISIVGDSYTIEQGQLNGQKQYYTTKCSPKNIGKTNETTAEQQCELEANAKWQSRVKSGYSVSSETPSTVKLPMKISNFRDHESKVKYPCIGEIKLNGVNGLYKLIDNELHLFSRGGNEYPLIPHLTNDIIEIMYFLNTFTLAGELYIHGEHLQDIQSCVTKHNSLTPKLTFNIFDLPDYPEDMYSARFAELLSISTANIKYSHVKGASYNICQNREDIEHIFNIAIDRGYEGIVIYNADAKYVYNVRSTEVFKYKPVLDDEFKFVSYKLDKTGFPVLVCETVDGKQFSVKPTGTAEQRKQLLSILDSKLNTFYKIEFETYSKDGIPLKPVGICFRSCSINGEPLE